MARHGPPELDQVFGSAFIKASLLLACLLAGYLIYRHGTKPQMEFISTNEVRLQRHDDGHYRASGSINGAPVSFMLDTGASMVSISPRIAKLAGLECEAPATFTTANGKVEGCVALREEIVFGGTRLFDIDVAIMPGMDDTALLGMNVLGKFDLRQSDGTLVISSKQVK